MLSPLSLVLFSSFSAACYAVGGVGVATCQSVAINYITHQLPQQCLRTGRSGAYAVPQTPTTEGATAGPTAAVTGAGASDGGDVGDDTRAVTEASATPSEAAPPATSSSAVEAPTADPPLETDAEDSPLDTAKFLSFEEWKAQNLARAGQSSDCFEKRVREPRKAVGAPIINALDALGEDAEIEIDFGGSDDGAAGGAPEYRVGRSDKSDDEGGSPDPRGHARAKNAGTTCKERFNYASFDCAATVHKTNPECKGATSILVENKDSYMLNECGAEKKFFIVELCDDILVDTVVLANFEFFSSMFRSFQVSVSDRYPVKQNGWKNLGTFEARNSREVQAFLIENPLIWARYLKVEFLTQYGNEFYCPVSLLRVHGTTMMEEFKHQVEAGGGNSEEDISEDVVPEAVAVNMEGDVRASTTLSQATVHEPSDGAIVEKKVVKTDWAEIQSALCTSPSLFALDPVLHLPVCEAAHAPSLTLPSPTPSSEPSPTVMPLGPPPATIPKTASPESITQSSAQNSKEPVPPSSSQPKKRETAPSSSKTVDAPGQEARQQAPPSAANPPPSVPTTQESFFKTVHKRLTLLEANASLSLQYIEEQSRILRDAFVKVEKRQMEKTTQFIERLNSTVLAELRGYRQQYDQLWQSTVIALESQREQSEREMVAISSRLTLLTDEVIFQKRMYQIQSVLLLITILIVLFSRNAYLDIPLFQHMRTRSALSMFDTPPTSPMNPSQAPRPSTHRHRRGSSSSINTVSSASIELSPPTPPENPSRDGSPAPEGTQSSPATPSGTRDSSRNRAWSQFGPKLRVENQGRRWQRLPSPLGSDEFDNSETGSEDLPGVGGEPGDPIYREMEDGEGVPA